MPSAADKASLDRINRSGDSDNAKMIPRFPEIPAEVKARFPSMKDFEQKVREWEEKMGIAIRGGPI